MRAQRAMAVAVFRSIITAFETIAFIGIAIALSMLTRRALWFSTAGTAIVISFVWLAWLFAMARFLVRWNDPGRTARLWGVGVVLLGCVVFHPLLFELRGNIGDAMFKHELRTGMTESAVAELIASNGGEASWPVFGPETNQTDVEAIVRFTTSATFCEIGGDEIRVYFDSGQRVRTWTSGSWAEGC
jgi:hypothetical protein